MKEITLEELSSPGCAHCRRFEEFWHSIESEWPNVKYRNVSVITPEGQGLAAKHMIFASPGILLDGEVWATGGFDKKRFLERLQKLSQ